MSRHVAKEELIDALLVAMRDQASRGLMMHQAIAERFGLGPTDIKCLDLARHEDRPTAGRIAQLTGLSTSSVTAVLDRLERRGFIERARDARDRRRVVVVPTERHQRELAELFAPLGEQVHSLLAEYRAEQLALFLELLGRLDAIAERVTADITAGGAGAARRGPLRRPEQGDEEVGVRGVGAQVPGGQ